MSVKTIMYVVLGIIYLIFQARKNAAKKKKKREQELSNQEEPTRETQQPERKREIYEPVQEETPASLEDLMEQYFPQEVAKPKVVEKTINPKKDLQAYKEKLQEKFEVEEDDGHMDHFDPYDHKTEYKSKWSKMLQSQDGARDAFVASEIFNKKY